MKSIRLILAYQQTNEHYGLYDDLKHDETVLLHYAGKQFISPTWSVASKCLKQYRRIFNALKRRMPFLSYFSRSESKLLSSIKNAEHFVVVDGALNYMSVELLLYLRKKNPSTKFHLFFINSFNANVMMMYNVREQMKRIHWDTISTFDPEDAKNQGFKFLGFNYYSKHDIKLNSSPQNDISLIATISKDREDIFHDMYIYLTENGCKCDFLLRKWFPLKRVIDGIEYLDEIYMSYKEVLERVQNSKCILEIVRDAQAGATLRYFEAVCYNRKLLTNNPHIVNYPFYESRYMKIFKTLQDIDVEWLTNDEIVDYGYNGEFSPTHLRDNYLKLQK